MNWFCRILDQSTGTPLHPSIAPREHLQNSRTLTKKKGFPIFAAHKPSIWPPIPATTPKTQRSRYLEDQVDAAVQLGAELRGYKGARDQIMAGMIWMND